MDGWLIEVGGRDGGAATPARYFASAQANVYEALIAVQKVTDAAPRLKVHALAPMAPEVVARLGLAGGGVLELASKA